MKGWMAIAIILVLLVSRAAESFEPPLPSNSSEEKSKLTFFITDHGIDQYKDGDVLRTGNDFSSAKSCVSPTLPSDAQFLIVMPPHEKMEVMSDPEITSQIFETLKTKVESAIAGGRSTFEVQVIEHIGKLTYISKGHQEAVNRFGRLAYEAIGMLHDHLASNGHPDQVFHGVFGSNGTKVFSENVAAWRGYVHDAVFFDGRAFKTPMIETIRALGERNVSIFNTAGDWLAPNNVFVHSIGNHDVVKELKTLFPGLVVGWIDPIDRLDYMGQGHLAAMQSDRRERFLVKFWRGDSYTPPMKMSSSQLLPSLPFMDASSKGNKNAGHESGVSLKTEIGPESFIHDESGRAEEIREKILKERPAKEVLSWPVEGERTDE